MRLCLKFADWIHVPSKFCSQRRITLYRSLEWGRVLNGKFVGAMGTFIIQVLTTLEDENHIVGSEIQIRFIDPTCYEIRLKNEFD